MSQEIPRTVIFDFDQDKSVDIETHSLFRWWSEKTFTEKHMLPLSMDEMKETLLMAIFAFSDNGSQIAAAGIFLPRTGDKSEPRLKGRRVVELGTNFVDPEHRGHHIGSLLINERLRHSHEKNWLPVSISSNPVVQKAFRSVQGVLMEENDEYGELRELLCLRCEEKDDCKLCPRFSGCAWIFPEYVHAM